MKLPATKVPTRKKWTTLRDKSGGKKGLAKVSIGKSLDTFHAAIPKIKSPDDMPLLTKAMSGLKKDLNAYVTTISKKKEYNELASTVKREVLSPLEAYGKAIQQEAKKEIREMGRVENHIRNVTTMTVKEANKVGKEIQGINQELSGMAKKYKYDLKKEDKPAIARLVKGATKVVTKADQARKTLDKELLSLVNEYARDRKSLLKKHNAALSKAKTAVSKLKKDNSVAAGFIKQWTAALK